VLPNSSLVASRWRLPTEDAWGRYSKVTLLSALDRLAPGSQLPEVTQLDVVRAAADAAYHASQMVMPPGVMLLVDLRGAASVAFGATYSLRARRPTSPVLTFNNWPDENGFVPAEETLAACVQFAPKIETWVQTTGPSGQAFERQPVFLLDAWRLAFRDDEVDDDVYDNRYGLTQADLPTAETLRDAGITRLLYVVESLDDTDKEEDDLNAMFQSYQAAGIGLYMVDLAFLRKLESSSDWGRLFAARAIWAKPRETVVTQPWFYQRSLGGFGGWHARPLRIGPFFSGSGGGGLRGGGG
jgi:hypothetical protein